MILVITTCDNEVKDVTKFETFDEAVRFCLEDAESNGFVPGTMSKKRLRSELCRSKSYDDGEVTVTIWHKLL